jgi:toxin ParE1/3/4
LTPPPPRPLRFTRRADADLDQVLRWTAQRFGEDQAERYRGQILETIRHIVEAPFGQRTRARDDVLPGLSTAHVRTAGRRGRHVVLFRVPADGGIVVTRLLHDAMDLARHIPPPDAP